MPEDRRTYPLSPDEAHALGNILRDIDRDPSLSGKLNEFNREVDMHVVRNVTLHALYLNFLEYLTQDELPEQFRAVFEAEMVRVGFSLAEFEQIRQTNQPLTKESRNSPYFADVLEGYRFMVIDTPQKIHIATLDSASFQTHVFPKTRTDEEFQEAHKEGVVLLGLRKSLKTDPSGITALEMIAQDRFDTHVAQVLRPAGQKKADAYLRGMHSAINDYRNCFQALRAHQEINKGPKKI